MKRLLFFNRMPIVDAFVTKMISSEVSQIAIVRTTSELRAQTNAHRFDILLLNVDDRMSETNYIHELLRLKKRKIKVIVFGQYEDQIQILLRAGVSKLMPDEAQENDFLSALM